MTPQMPARADGRQDAHDEQSTAELERVRCELRAQIGFLTHCSAAPIPIMAQLEAVGNELERRAVLWAVEGGTR